MDSDYVGKCLLAQPALGAQATQVRGKAMLNIHVPAQTQMSSINLQTISDIPVDFVSAASGSVVTDRMQDSP